LSPSIPIALDRLDSAISSNYQGFPLVEALSKTSGCALVFLVGLLVGVWLRPERSLSSNCLHGQIAC